MTSLPALLTVALAASLLCLPASAQDSRAGSIAEQQAEKSERLEPRIPNAAERVLMAVRHSIEAPSGFHPVFGSVYSGGGFTLGGGYRHSYGDRSMVNVTAMFSAKAYKLLELGTFSLGHFRDRVDVGARVGWRDATQVAYHGLGIDSPAEPAAAFRMEQAYAGAEVTYRPLRILRFRGGAYRESYILREPSGDAAFVDDVFDETGAPGAGLDPVYTHTLASAAVDWRPAADYTRRGGLYEFRHQHFRDHADTFTFTRVDVITVQHIPILRENWVISLRGQLQSALGDTDRVPYFLLPSLGSGSTLRAYSSWRFRDRNAVLASGEFRWIPNRLALDLALFYDTGMVAPAIDDFTTSALVDNVGIGVRFHGPRTTPLRIELAHGREGLHLVFGGSAAF